MDSTVNMVVNGRKISRRIDTRTVLAEFLRQEMKLTGTHVGCDTTQCGCCTVLVDGDAVKSCTFLAVQAEGCEITSIEGLANGTGLHPVQKAFHEHHALQCGFCTPGFIMSVTELVAKYPALDPHKVRELIEGNICRCTGYQNIVKAALAAQAEIAGEAAGAEGL